MRWFSRKSSPVDGSEPQPEKTSDFPSRQSTQGVVFRRVRDGAITLFIVCPFYTSDAADDPSRLDTRRPRRRHNTIKINTCPFSEA